jgi:hypothetical protein
MLKHGTFYFYPTQRIKEMEIQAQAQAQAPRKE